MRNGEEDGTLKESTILVPLADNYGRPFGAEVFASIEAELLERFGGFTRQAGISGVWKSPSGEVFEDAARGYTVATADRNAMSIILMMARRWCMVFQQQAMYVRLPGGKAQIVSPDEE